MVPDGRLNQEEDLRDLSPWKENAIKQGGVPERVLKVQGRNWNADQWKKWVNGKNERRS